MQNYVLLETNNTLQGDLSRDDVGRYYLLPDSVDRQIGIRLWEGSYTMIGTIVSVALRGYNITMISIYDVHFHRIYDV